MKFLPHLRPEARDPSLLEVVDALILYDTPLLDQRFQDAIAMHPDAAVRATLAALPSRVAQGSRLTRRAGVEWERVTRASALDDDFKNHAERFLLEGFLDSAEAQIRLKTFMARHAPTREVRELIDDAIGIHRELTAALRHALQSIEPMPDDGGASSDACVGTEAPEGDLRGQVEAAIRGACARGAKPRLLVLSPNALRHLRDQGLFANGATSVLDVAVQVDMGWGGSAFAVLTVEAMSLDEMKQPA